MSSVAHPVVFVDGDAVPVLPGAPPMLVPVVEVVVAQSKAGRGVLGVIDGESPRGVESERDVADRKRLLRQLGYKR